MTDIDRLTDELVRWCAIPTHEDAPEGQRRMADALVDALEPVMTTTACVPVGPAHLPVVHAASFRPGERPVLLVGHYDTVPHDGDASEPTCTIRDGRLYARGAADMKGGLVVLVEAIRRAAALERCPPVEVVIVPDEEIGTPWSRRLLMDAAHRARVALVMEPATVDGGLVRRRKGVGTVAVDITGRAAHAGRNPSEGRSAIAAMAAIVAAVDALGDDAAGTTVNVTTVTGGSAANVIAAHAHMQVDVRVETIAEGARVTAAIAAITERVARSHDVSAQVTGGMHRPPMPRSAVADGLVASYRTTAAARGLDISWTDVGGGSDANLVAQAAIPVLDGLGVCGGDLHGPSEFADLASLCERAELLAELLMSLRD